MLAGEQEESVDFSSITALNLRSNNLKILPKELFLLTSRLSLLSLLSLLFTVNLAA